MFIDERSRFEFNTMERENKIDIEMEMDPRKQMVEVSPTLCLGFILLL